MAIFLKALYRETLKSSIYNPIKSSSNTDVFYFSAGRVDEWSTGPFVPDVETGTVAELRKTRDNLICGLRVTADQVAFVGQRNAWVANTVYLPFDDDNRQTNFYTINSSNSIYKCISNNNSAKSTVEPQSISPIGTFETSDGYIWKYMGSVSSINMNRFASTNTIPLIDDANVVASAVPGTVDAMTVVEPGTSYRKYAVGTGITPVANTVLNVNGLPNEGDDYFKDCVIAVTGGTGLGSMYTVSGSTSNSSGNFLVVTTTANVDVTSSYVVSPAVTIVGDGSGARAYVNINANGGVSNVVVMSAGTNYTHATASVGGDTIAPAVIKPHISSLKGHGSNIINELDSAALTLSTEFTKSIEAYLPNDITYYQFALIKNPMNNSNVNLTANVITFPTHFASADGVTFFTKGEYVKGQTSNAKGIVLSSNASSTIVHTVSGTFANTEVVIGQSSLATTAINGTLSSDYGKGTGTIIYYSDVSAINRSNTVVSEKIRCTINLEG